MKIKTLQTNKRREYLSDQFKELCDERGIEQQLTIFGTLQQNRVMERKNRKLIGQS
jgi:transposase InsO family protein